jgi:hypothetical protein
MRALAIAATASLGCVALATAALPAGAQNAVEHKTTVTIHRGTISQPIFFGKVKGSPACISHRKIKVFEVAPDQGLLDFTTSNESGKWTLDTQITDSTQAKAVATFKTTSGGPGVCPKAVSKVISF